jgi:hypothetical protein
MGMMRDSKDLGLPFKNAPAERHGMLVKKYVCFHNAQPGIKESAGKN